MSCDIKDSNNTDFEKVMCDILAAQTRRKRNMRTTQEHFAATIKVNGLKEHIGVRTAGAYIQQALFHSVRLLDKAISPAIFTKFPVNPGGIIRLLALPPF